MTNISALQSALSGLLAQRQALDVIGHDLANANTDGLITGDGVDVVDVSRYRDDFLETRALGERSASAQLGTKSTYLDRIELENTEPSDRGLAGSLAKLWAAFDEVANHPGDIPQRSAALEQASATVDQFRFMDAQMRSLHHSAVGEAKTLAAQVKDLATEVATLNDALRPLMLSNATPNDLFDERDVAVVKLADLVGARVQNREDGTIDLYVGGSTLVRCSHIVELTAETTPDPSLADVGLQLLSFTWVGGGPVVPTGGEAAGLLSVANDTIPNAIRDLDTIAEALVTDVNTFHATGQDLDLDTGWDFFDPTNTKAATISLSANVDGRPRRIAAAEAGAGEWDATVAQQISGLRSLVDGPDDKYAELVGSLGIQVASTRARSVAQTSVLRRIDEARLSARSVDIDEETTDLVAAQRVYEASARAINAVDEMLDVLVNRLGLVGR